MNNLTPAQIQAIQGWTGQRDTLLREIGVLSTQKEELVKTSTDLGLSNIELEKQIENKRGRLAELDALELRHRGSVSTDIAELEIRKSRLEGECLLKQAEVETAVAKYGIITAALSTLQTVHDTMSDQAAIVNRIAGELVQTTQVASSDMKVVMSEIKAVAEQVIDRGNENLAQTAIILDKLPRYIFELQKPIPVRRVYRAPAGAQIEPQEPMTP